MKLKSVINSALILVFITSIGISAESEISEKGVIFGIVLNKDDRSPVIGANVKLRGSSLGAGTDLDGKYRISNIPPDIYAIQVSAIGFLPLVQTDVVVNNVRPVEVNFSLFF